jgi:hypothetical protein
LTRRSRITAYGTAVALVLIGVACAAVISGGTGETLAMAFIGVGLVGLVSLAFLEVGLSEDRDRARERPARERPARERPAPQRGNTAGGVGRPRTRQLGRRRGQRRRLP